MRQVSNLRTPLEGNCNIGRPQLLVDQIIADAEHVDAGSQRLKAGGAGSQRACAESTASEMSVKS
jgi:hypothetical protein